ncbi:chemoreceptor glutamine deamidase CheD [Methylomonas sp. SURF-2]|uniref:Probable chemoreceptor glutamine deamidase CheD n=1 Tax=Methylomonas subterranea TaxID=2952225 RepID=A0ABT1TIE5_9GAMM|nr:chemoreceptor glutamine deamidase CheD [Methylomonas sp. SURF-2]MCQ8105230.1 chemoreceptor glutamine deamidase CheD [Methylomonas sp. SURF-2]
MTTHREIVGPASIPGFENINRYWDKENHLISAKLLPGDYYVTKDNEMITTVLGSCVSACIRDNVLGIGGMNHFMLPETSRSRLNSREEAVVGTALRYGNYAMEHLINTILQYGGKRKNLEVKLFGGSKIIATLGDVGARNIEFVLDYVDMEALKLASHDLGGIYPRKVNFFPQSGRVRMKKIKDLHNETIVLREKRYGSQIRDISVESSIELF